jgi:hypothetical protein
MHLETQTLRCGTWMDKCFLRQSFLCLFGSWLLTRGFCVLARGSWLFASRPRLTTGSVAASREGFCCSGDMRLLGRERWDGLVAGRAGGREAGGGGRGAGMAGMAGMAGDGWRWTTATAHRPTSPPASTTRLLVRWKDTNCCSNDQTNALTLHSAPGQVMGRDGLSPVECQPARSVKTVLYSSAASLVQPRPCRTLRT